MIHVMIALNGLLRPHLAQAKATAGEDRKFHSAAVKLLRELIAKTETHHKALMEGLKKAREN